MRFESTCWFSWSSLISSGPRVILIGQKIAEFIAPRVRKTALKCMKCGGAEDWMHVYHQAMLSHRMTSQGFALDSTVRCEHLSRKSPRLGMQETAWLTQFGLGNMLQLEGGPAAHWACYEATVTTRAVEPVLPLFCQGGRMWTYRLVVARQAR